MRFEDFAIRFAVCLTIMGGPCLMASTVWRKNTLYTGISGNVFGAAKFFFVEGGLFRVAARRLRMATAGWRGVRLTGILLETHNIFDLASLATHNIFNFAFFANVDARPDFR